MMAVRILIGDVRERLHDLPDESVHCVVTSPPYFGLRDYGMAGQIGLEKTPDAFVVQMVGVFHEVRRVLRKDGTLWLNLGDSYSVGNAPGGGKQGESWRLRGVMTPPNRMPLPGLKPKDLIGIPWRVAFALQADGWYLRQDIIWHKPNPMPESVRDRCTKAHEYLFLLSKSERYFYDAEAIAEAGTGRDPGNITHKYDDGSPFNRTKAGLVAMGAAETRNRRSVWTITTQAFPEAHFATFPPELPELCIRAGCPKGGTVLDPFFGAGTTGLVADRLGRNCIGIELNPQFTAMAAWRVEADSPLFAQVAVQPDIP
jgi:DNA modification methylase